MRLLKRVIAFLILAVVAMFGVLFTIQNTDTVPLDLLIFQLSEQRIALWVLLAFACGGIIGMLISAALILRLKSKNMLLQRKFTKSENELAALRTSDYRVSSTK